MEAPLATTSAAPLAKDHQTLYQQTSQLVLSPRTEAFDLEREAPKLRNTYGRSAFGQGCLMARRLIEAGVTFVEVESKGWDTHANELTGLKKLIPPVDQGTAALLRDLKDRGLLQNTLVVWMVSSAANRTSITAGRDHYPKPSTWHSPAGVKGGQVIALPMPRASRPTAGQCARSFLHVLPRLGADPRRKTHEHVRPAHQDRRNRRSGAGGFLIK